MKVRSRIEPEPVKVPVRAATTAPGTLSTDFDSAQSIDGVPLEVGDRVLIKDQGTASQNGIYVVQAAGEPVRAVDFDQNWKVESGVVVFVEEGTLNAQTGWVLANPNPITVGTTGLIFRAVGGVRGTSTWTPALSSVGGSTQPSLGGGSAAGFFHRTGRRVVFDLTLTFGASAAAGVGGLYVVSLPVAPVSSRTYIVGPAVVSDASASALVRLASALIIPSISTSSIVMVVDNGAFGAGTNPVGPTVPWAWAASDTISISGDYEAAAG